LLVSVIIGDVCTTCFYRQETVSPAVTWFINMTSDGQALQGGDVAADEHRCHINSLVVALNSIGVTLNYSNNFVLLPDRVQFAYNSAGCISVVELTSISSTRMSGMHNASGCFFFVAQTGSDTLVNSRSLCRTFADAFGRPVCQTISPRGVLNKGHSQRVLLSLHAKTVTPSTPPVSG
jgi:hypothetical protein